MNTKISQRTVCMLFFFLMPLLGMTSVMCATSNDYMSSYTEEGGLQKAFQELSNLETFEKIEAKDYEQLFPEHLGQCKGLIAPNSHLRDEILKILKGIPYRYLYSEARTQNDKISRCYIESVSTNQYQMMYVIVGKGGNDVVVALFSDAELDKYKEFGDTFKQATYEEVEESVIKTNAECPVTVGTGMEITSMSINDRYWTMRMNIDTRGQGLSNINKEKAKTMLKGVSKYQVSQLFNLNICFRMVYKSETGETVTVVLEHDDLAEILNDTETTPDDVLQTYIENNKKACPLEIEKGMVMTDVSLIEDVLCHEITVDEEMYSVELMEGNSDTIKESMMGLISSGQDMTLSLISNWLVKSNKGLAYMYIGNKSENVAIIIITCDELRELLSL